MVVRRETFEIAQPGYEDQGKNLMLEDWLLYYDDV